MHRGKRVGLSSASSEFQEKMRLGDICRLGFALSSQRGFRLPRGLPPMRTKFRAERKSAALFFESGEGSSSNTDTRAAEFRSTIGAPRELLIAHFMARRFCMMPEGFLRPVYFSGTSLLRRLQSLKLVVRAQGVNANQSEASRTIRRHQVASSMSWADPCETPDAAASRWLNLPSSTDLTACVYIVMLPRGLHPMRSQSSAQWKSAALVCNSARGAAPTLIPEPPSVHLTYQPKLLCPQL
jgi:hypothetical protein